MSKFVKNLQIDDVKKKLAGVGDALLVSILGMDAIKNQSLRAKLRSKNIQLLLVKNSLARRAVEGTPLAAAFEQAEGSLCVVWGGTDIVSLAKEVVALADDKTMAPFQARGGVVDGQRIAADQVKSASGRRGKKCCPRSPDRFSAREPNWLPHCLAPAERSPVSSRRSPTRKRPRKPQLRKPPQLKFSIRHRTCRAFGTSSNTVC
jgi:large subunit ribosomal protein L10